MTKKFLIIASLLLAINAGCSPEKENAEIDLLFTNAKIWTGNEAQPWADWLAIEKDKIAEVGIKGKAMPKARQIIDLNGQLMLPGFNDSHVHFASAGHLLLGINLLDVNDSTKFVERVKETTARLPKGSWITRGDWGAYEAWEMGSEGNETKNSVFIPDRSWIDSLSTNHPVLVTRYDRKVGLANQIALDYLNLDSETGILEGNILKEALQQIPDKSFEQKVAEAQRALEECRKWGVTTVQDMSPLGQVDIYNFLRERDELTCRINFCPSKLSDYQMMQEKGWVVDWENEYGPSLSGDDWIAFGTIKTHIDGIMGARTARFFEPYSDNSLEMKSWRGGWREFSEDMNNFKDMILKADQAGIQLRIHAIGDEANSILLDILDTLDQVNGPKDRRFRLVHAQVIAPQDFERFANRKIVAEVQPYHVTDDMRWMEERIGYTRCQGAYAFKTLQDAGCMLSFGSDWPGTNASYYPINPMYGLYAAVTRQTIHGTPEEGWFPEQKIGLEDAIRAYTWGSSFGAFEERIKGTIEVGKLADLVVLNTNLFETAPSEWLKTTVNYTVVGGKIVYTAE
ncbi:amidohydrolase [Fulvivirgaceae bacterium BMA10]|uniref:Amidohydrolase n=1 Tax=Splendidivirga corallicola TaxID=3051826 RepID=A0ABT8KZ02_9BACT|nr:amidohydrolase [Fulvivirgaceae bacterium BMA10]